MLKTYNNFLSKLNESNIDTPDGLPEEVVKSSLMIARSMYEKVKKSSFFDENEDFFVKFEVTPMDFKYIDPNEVLPLDLSIKAMEKRQYYVELEYDDQIPTTNEVVYKIIFENMTPNKYGEDKEEKEFVDKYEDELRMEQDEDEININNSEQ